MLFGAWPLGSKGSPSKSGTLRFIALLGCYILFLVIGAAIFSAIEAPKADELSKTVNSSRIKFLQRNPCVNGKYTQ